MNNETEIDIVSANALPDEGAIEINLRPQALADYIGQDMVKGNLSIAIKAAAMRQEPIEHVLLSGPPGLGKTTLANIIAKELNSSIHITSGPAIERAGDLASIITNLGPGDVLFIDEIHRLNKTVEEILYSAMEDFALDLVLGKGPGARTVRVDLPKFTLIGATTKPGAISAPLRDRFGLTFRLNYYLEPEIEKIIHRSSKILEVKIEPGGVKEIAKRSRRTPRVANRLLKRIRDFAQVKGSGVVNEDVSRRALDNLAVDTLGLDESDRRILTAIIEKFHGGPVGLQTLAAACMEDEDTIADIHEPYLMQIGFLKRTPQGRVITQDALEHLGLAAKQSTLNI
ncbi:MAG: Holliday junction DNA helicase RuvB [Candidatus Doudnabacteria bacterium RIFCSPHIGHO2_02_FULL_46_11]|uniref:Holliday junction branch migration complex subunit RuvB n=1 Tax=Candidatus Doudnabacteria bacterium RIFCSPHIGHO2_02_FULL_46_11 TaxID=1817832 RepID=A0A1F5P841_9BACT|nr:MAG: Holliday junction DNA helicase RuvB [Candidatus Doudnabacteria bacterium RIFCSPHIGHO2_02_FULL_46_11]